MKSFAHLKLESPFYDLFPHGMVPIVNVTVPSQTLLMVAVDQLTAAQLNGIAERLSTQSKCLSKGVIAKEILAKGLPLRASQISGTSTDSPFCL